MSSVFNDQSNKSYKFKWTNLVSITVNRDPGSGKEPANKKYIDDSLGEGFVLRFNEKLETYLKVSFGNDIYNPTEYDK